MCIHTIEQAREGSEPTHPLPATQTHPAQPGTTFSLSSVTDISGLERLQVVIVPYVCMTFPKLGERLHRHDLILAP